jgi:hypothetical protein
MLAPTPLMSLAFVLASLVIALLLLGRARAP